MYDHILVPTDGSPGVERAVEHAVDLAAAHGATLHALYVVNTASYSSMPMETSWEHVRDMLGEEGEQALERVQELVEPEGVGVETIVVDGSPSREIVHYAEDGGIDLIVMGTHGRGGIDRLLLGSVAERVVRASKVPVLTVRVGDDA
jgi:nucleotide-binding universal stress UspA family protein